jgi:hypothetical protein
MSGLLRSRPPEVLVAWTGFAVLLVLVLASPHRLVYDEPAYLLSIDQLREDGLGVYFLRHLTGHAGPLYTFIQYAAGPLTGLHGPWVRLINPLLFLGAVRLLSAHSGERGFSVNLLGCPFLGMSVAMALTEIPALFCVCATLLLYFQAKAVPESRPATGWALAAGAGICFGLAILGRQTYLPILAAFVILIGSPRQALGYLLFVLAAALVFMPIFGVWGGIIPPGVERGTAGFNTEHAVLAFAYMGFATLFIAPRFLLFPWREFFAVAAVSVVINLLFHLVAYSPAIGLTSRILPHSFQPFLVFILSAPLSILAGVTLAASLRAGWQHRRDLTYLFYLGVSALLMLECGKMTQVFSSRYVVCVLPFWLFVLRPWFDTGKFKAARFAAAAGINALLPIAYWYW